MMNEEEPVMFSSFNHSFLLKFRLLNFTLRFQARSTRVMKEEEPVWNWSYSDKCWERFNYSSHCIVC
jgi:hypothetical protein